MKTLTDKIRDLLDAGKSRVDIMLELKIKRQNLANHWPMDRPVFGSAAFQRRCDLVRKHGRNVVRMRNDGHSLTSISKKMRLNMHDVRFVWRNGPSKGKFVPSRKMREAVRKAAAKVGRNDHRVAVKTGLSRLLIREVLKDG